MRGAGLSVWAVLPAGLVPGQCFACPCGGLLQPSPLSKDPLQEGSVPLGGGSGGAGLVMGSLLASPALQQWGCPTAALPALALHSPSPLSRSIRHTHTPADAASHPAKGTHPPAREADSRVTPADKWRAAEWGGWRGVLWLRDSALSGFCRPC